MNPHITTIQFDATTFCIDEGLLQLLTAKEHSHELSPKGIHNDIFQIFTSDHNFGDSSGSSQHSHSYLAKRLLQLFPIAQTVAHPVAFYYIVEHHSPISLPANIFDSFPVYPFIATLGQKFDTWCNKLSTISQQYTAHIIGLWFLHRCVQNLAYTFNIGKSYCALYPGSFDALPLMYNHTLYSLFENEVHQAGITINQACMFTPLYTVAGFIVPNTNHKGCAICTLAQCQFRNILT
ncbi:MAG: hypothetical protein N3F66_09195 [Spirochaetes bacterium]|nr:hypothetical protein [Spirochaetota bacterium]